MAQLNITLNQEEILQLLSNDKSDAFAKLLQESRVCKKKSVNHCEYRTQKPSDLVQLVSTYKEDFSYGKTTA